MKNKKKIIGFIVGIGVFILGGVLTYNIKINTDNPTIYEPSALEAFYWGNQFSVQFSETEYPAYGVNIWDMPKESDVKDYV